MDGEAEPIDPDVDLRIASQRRELAGSHGVVLVVIGLGGGFGALARYGLAELVPAGAARLPWTTFCANVVGCLLIGVLMVLLTEVWSAHRLARPFLGVGFLGGFTTFSAYAEEIRALLASGAVAVAFAYLVGTFLCAMIAVTAGAWLTRAVRAPERAR